MRTNARRTAIWLAALVLMLPVLASAAREGRLVGKVVGPDGKPIPGVRVVTTCAELPDFRAVATTNDKGLFTVDFSKLNVLYVYEFDKVGYATMKVEQRWTLQGTERHEFKMQPAAEVPVVEGLAPASLSQPAIAAYNDGVRAFKAKDYATAQAKFQEAAQHDPELRHAWVALAALHLEQKHYADAAAATERALALGSTDESLLKTRWDAYRQIGDAEKAAAARADIERFGRLTEEAKGVYNQGVALTKVGDDKEAFEKFQEALALDPNFELALVGVATTGLKLDRATEAYAAAETLLKVNPQNAEAHKIRYNAALKLREEAKLLEALRGLAPYDAAIARDGLYRLGTAAFDKDEAAKAKERFREVLALDPNHAKAHYSLGLLLMREGAKVDARRHLERFLQLAPDDPDAGTARDALNYLKSS
jgi:Tfp pilus assembly protein PilF